MDAERWTRIEALLDQLLDLPEGERLPALELRAAHDPELLRDALRYLDACERADDELRFPSLDLLAAKIGADPEDPSSDHQAEGTRDRDQLSPGDLIGTYRIAGLLGRGGMGAVYLAERADGAFSRQVAIKVVKRGMDTDEIIARFRHEREILARLRHPNIARLLDGGVTPDGLPYFVMELVRGAPIDRWCDEHHLDVHERVRLFMTVCEAVRYAHGALVVHRDLKPGNILVDDGEARLLDFGIAKLLAEDGAGDATGAVARRLTPDYAAPEQIRGEPTSTAVDVYALGVILFELLTGELPFRMGGRMTPTERAARDRAPTLPSIVVLADGEPGDGRAVRRAMSRQTTPDHLRDLIRGDLDAILMRALAHDPDRRYPSVEAFAADIERHLQGRPVLARPDSSWYRASRFVRRNRVLVALASVATLALVGGSIATTMLALVANRERDQRQLEAERAVAARDFVVDIFAALDPDLGTGTNRFSRAELIELGARGLDQVGDQPELRAGVLNTLGQVAFNLGDRNRADEFFREAWSLIEGEPNDPEAAATMMGIGEVLRAELRFDEAETWFARALALRGSLFPSSDPRVTESRVALALALYNQGSARYDEAESIYEELLADAAPAPLRIRAAALGGFANLRLGQGRHAEAEDLYLRAIDVRRAMSESLDPVSARVLWGLGHARRLMTDLAGAEEAYREALDVHEEAYGDRHGNVAWGWYNLAGVLEERGELDAAAEGYRFAAELMSEIEPPDYLYTAFAWHGLGRVEMQRDRITDAEAALMRALDVYRAQPAGDESTVANWVAGIHLTIGRIRLDQGAWLAAEAELRAAHHLFSEVARHPLGEGRATEALVALFDATGRPDSAAVYRAGR